MSEQSLFVALKCNACGGSLQVPTSQVVAQENGAFVVASAVTFVCEHCGTQYTTAQSLQRFETTSGIFIASSATVVVHGDMIGGDKHIKQETPSGDSGAKPEPKAEGSSPKPEPVAGKKKWWQRK